MGISFNDLTRDERTIVVVLKENGFDGEEVEITYRPSVYTPRQESRTAKMMKDNIPLSALAESLAETLVRWDVLDVNGKEINVSLDEMNKTPGWFLITISEAIGADMQARREEIKNLEGGSLRGASRGKSRSGTR